ncbi:MAG: hypothetical protein MZV64_48985, partial [Ignavibacteriales bacterium]|nr:hypothetical protein [Ignavibacteriales bacterium]
MSLVDELYEDSDDPCRSGNTSRVSPAHEYADITHRGRSGPAPSALSEPHRQRDQIHTGRRARRCCRFRFVVVCLTLAIRN